MNTPLILFSTTLIVLACTEDAVAALANGSLEDLDSSYSEDPGWDLDSNAAATGWTTWGLTSPDWVESGGSAGRYSTPYGDHFALAGATGSFSPGVYREGVSQTVAGFEVGQAYEISFSHANGLRWNDNSGGFWEGVGTTGGWQILVDSTSIGLVASSNDNGIAAAPWTLIWQSSSVTFTATATSHDIHFIAYKPDSPDQNPSFQFLDEVDVQPVPEPSVAWLACLGGVFLMHRRR